MNSDIATELSDHEKLMRVHGYLRGITEYDHGAMGGNLAGKTPSQIVEELIKMSSVSVETKTETQLEEAFREADQVREDLGKPKAHPEPVQSTGQNERNETTMMLAFRAADKMAWICDMWVQRNVIDARSALADARLRYGEPFKYSWSELEAPSVSDGGGEHASRALFQKSAEPASGKFKMSIFEELLTKAQTASNVLQAHDIGTAHYEIGIQLQLAIERAAK